MRTISIEAIIESHSYKDGVKTRVERTAELKADDLSFNRVGEFMQKFKKLNAALKKAIKNNDTVELVITNYDYVNGLITNYNRWRFYGNAREEAHDGNEFTGFYMSPDTKYTPEHHDMSYDMTLTSITD